LKLARGAKDKEHAMSQKIDTSIAVVGIDIGKELIPLALISAARSCCAAPKFRCQCRSWVKSCCGG
jgi:hypothetical protein